MCTGLQCLVSEAGGGGPAACVVISSSAARPPAASSPVMVPTAGRPTAQAAAKRSAATAAQEAFEKQQHSGRLAGPAFLSQKTTEKLEIKRDRAFGFTLERLTALLRPSTAFERELNGSVEELVPGCAESVSGSCCVESLGKQLREMGYTVWVRVAVGGGSEWFRHLKHSFLLVEGDPRHPDQLYVVDPNFRDQFTIARTTPQYNRLMADLPGVFVGRGKKLLPIIQLVCSEITVAFAAQEMEVPPWRRRSSMVSKWMPDRKKDYVPGN